MPFLSYAQNLEDVLLWRVFGGIGAGFYVDVGAAHPDEDSVTRAFYDRGWRGINIEPVPALARLLADARPRDVTLALAAGSADGASTLHVVDGTGLSTTDAGIASMLEGIGHRSSPIRVPLRRLSSILDEHAPDEIHFLKIDVEGAERAVLEGCDFSVHRPRVLLLEATRPLSPEPTHHLWEDLLVGAGYRFVYFDGLNRFYAAEEWHAALAHHFTIPVNVLDDYVRLPDARSARQAAQQAARTDAAEAAARAAYAKGFEAARDLGRMRTLLETADGLAQRTQAQLRATEAAGQHSAASAAAAAAECTALRTAVVSHENRVAALQLHLDALHRSTSWGVTRPLRGLSRLMRSPSHAAPPVRQRADPGPIDGPAPARPPTVVVSPPCRFEPAIAPGRETAAVADHRPYRTVHQFHSGSATNDAVTNSMLMVRGRLRRLGYRSEIFVTHRDPALATELRLLADLPPRADHVLIVHHSMGHDALDTVVAHPAPKILYYHNITPPELLPETSSFRHYARLGRRQLHTLRDAVVAAVAASEYNAIELRRDGFDPVMSCSLLFDLAALKAKAAGRPERQTDRPFTVLFVGRVIASKGQADLVEAFARFRNRLGRPARLVLAGRTDSPGDYLQVIDTAMRAHGLEAELIVTGQIADDELSAQFREADLYVSMSCHEGFGVPLIEAIAHGVPVLAWCSGAVPYTLGDAGLFATRDPVLVAAAMLEVAQDPDRRAALMAAQRAAMDRFDLDLQWPVMQAALGRAGVAPPPDPAVRAGLAKHLALTLIGHVQGSYSLAAINRGMAAALEAELPGRVRLVAVAGERVEDLSGLPDDVRAVAARGPHVTGPEIVISQHYPVHRPEEGGDLRLALVFWEESLLPQPMIDALSDGFDGVLAPSRFVAKALIDSGLRCPVRVIGQAPDLSDYQALAQKRPPVTAPRDTFEILHVSSCFPRKGLDVLLAAYARAFRRSDKVRLTIKSFPNPHNTALEQVAALRARDPDAPAIRVIDRDIDRASMLELYRTAHVMALPTRGEGLNLPAAEAMAAGLPLIVTGFGGHMDFCDQSTARLLGSRLEPSMTHLAVAHSLWAEPDEDDLVRALQEIEGAHRNPETSTALQTRVALARTRVAQRLGRRPMARRLQQAALDLMLSPPAHALRVAWVTSWGVRCGVAEYSRHLIGARPARHGEVETVVLSDDRTEAVRNGPVRSRPAWSVGDTKALDRLADAVAAEGPDVVVVQHQPGLIPWITLARWLVDAAAARPVVVTLHNTRDLTDLEETQQAEVSAALARAARVVVHSLVDLRVLKRSGLIDNVVLIPHGVRDPLPARLARDPGDAPLIGCYGFFLPGKGIGELIQAFALLRSLRPRARLRLVNADYGEPISADEIDRCRAIAQAAGVQGAIDWETGFLPDEGSFALLSACDVVVIPTQASKESSSAAVRTALAAGAPVLVTPLPLFDDVGDAVLRSSGTGPEALSAGIEAILSDPLASARVQAAAQAWATDHAWTAVSERFYGMLRGLGACHALFTDNKT